MTYIPEFLPKMTNNDPLARCALFVAFEGMGLLDLTGPLTVLRSASKFEGTAAPARLVSQPGRCAECLLCADTVAKVPKCRTTYFSLMGQKSNNRWSVCHQVRYRGRL
jgi:hypothetical protein